MEKVKPDYSTLDMAKLRQLQLWKGPPTYKVSDSEGECCFGDPPGYPTYFLRSIYTQHGNSPHRGPQRLILGRVVESSSDWRESDTSDTYNARLRAFLRSLWKPLPLDHPRTQAWIVSTLQHQGEGYVDDNQVVKPFEYGRPAVVYNSYGLLNLKEFHDDPRFSDEWRQKEQAQVEQYNAELLAKFESIRKPENLQAVRIIREYYPEYQYSAGAVELARSQPRPGDWWERYAERFTAENCPGLPFRTGGDWSHRQTGWCQMCGLTDGK